MTELHFRIGLYDPRAIGVAVEAFSKFAQIEREQNGDIEVVRVTAPEGTNEADLSAELANYALGATVDGLGAEAAEAASS